MAIIWLATTLLLSACTGGDRPLQFNLGTETLQLDWNRAIDSSSMVVLDNVMEGLTTFSGSLQGATVELVRPLPALAASWSIAEDGAVYRFHLRPGVYWSDGVELDAQHFVDSWQRLLAPWFRSANAYHLFEIVGAQEYAEGKEKDFSRVGIKAIDAHTLEVRLKHSVPYFLHLVAAASTFPVRKDLIEKFGDQWTDPANLVTLGPYRITEWSQGERLVLSASSNYHGARPSISTVVCRLVTEPLTAYALYENGDLDILPRDLPPSIVRRLQQTPEYRTGPKLQTSYLLFNTRKPPFHLAANRRAFIRALNRQRLAAYFPGNQTPTSGWLPPGLLGASDSVGIQSEETESGILAGKSVELRYSGSDTWNLVFQSLQQDLETRLKLNTKLVQLDSYEYGQFLAQLANRRHGDNLPQVVHMGWVADYPDSHSFMNVFTSTSESNYGGWHNEAYDKLVASAVATNEEGARAKLYLQAQKILLEDEAALMPLFITSHQALVRADVKGVQLNVLDKWYFQHLLFEEKSWRKYGGSFLRRLKGAPSTGA